MAKEKNAAGRQEVQGDKSHLEDHVMKTAAQFFGEILLPCLGMKGEIAGIAPTEQIHLEVKRMEEDFNFIMKDGSWRHLEFESDRITEADLRRFREYDAYMSMVYKVPVTTAVVCSADVKVLKNKLVNGMNHYRVEIIRLKDKNADRLFQSLERQLEAKERLTRSQIVPLLLTPFMSGEMKKAERIGKSLDILQSDAVKLEKEDQKRMESVLYALAVKFLDREELEQLKERMRMTLLGQMLREDGIEEGMERGIKRGIEKGMERGMEKGELTKLITLVLKKSEKGQCCEKIAEDLMEDAGVIRRIYEAVKLHPGENAESLYHILRP